MTSLAVQSKTSPYNGTQTFGRPSIFNQDLANRICSLVSTHTDGIHKLCRDNPDLPAPITINLWRFQNEDFATQYMRAKQCQAQIIAESLVDLCELKSIVDEEGLEKVDSGMVGLLRLKIDAIKWQASKLVPKLYGDKVQNEHTIVVKHEDALAGLE